MSGGTKLYEKYSFQKRDSDNDGYGNTVTGFVEQFETRGERTFFRGSEKVREAASTGTQNAIIRVRSFGDSRLVTTGWRVVDARTNETYNVIAIEPMKERGYIEFLVQSGEADG